MLRSSVGPPIKSEVQTAVDEVLKEDFMFDQIENRSAHHEHLVRPVDIELQELGETIPSFSRYVSGVGIGLISHEAINEKMTAVLKIMRLNGKPLQVFSECRWVKPYGDQWYLSGWQFVKIHHVGDGPAVQPKGELDIDFDALFENL